MMMSQLKRGRRRCCFSCLVIISACLNKIQSFPTSTLQRQQREIIGAHVAARSESAFGKSLGRGVTSGSCQFSFGRHPFPGSRRGYGKTWSQTALSALLPLQSDDLRMLLSTGVPSPLQYAVYWGRTPSERYGRLLESCIVSFLGVFFSYFLSFVLGGFVATILGTLFVFWGILSPYLKAFQRNWEFLSGRDLVDTDAPPQSGLYGALFTGYLADVCVVDEASSKQEYDLLEFADYTMESDEQERYSGQPYLLRILASDKSGRELQVHARLSEEYLGLQPGMPLCAILLSTTSAFDQLNGISDLYVPDADCWIGDYPYLERIELEALLAEDVEVWDALQAEAEGDFTVLRPQREMPEDTGSLDESDRSEAEPAERSAASTDASRDAVSRNDRDRVYARKRRKL